MPRLFLLIVFNVVLIGLVLAIAPQQAPVTLYKLSLVTLAGLVGYWLDRAIFPYARPDEFIERMAFKNTRNENAFFHSIIKNGQELAFSSSLIRRAIIVGCAMLAMGLGA